jgi:hypothetical protein
VCLPGLRWYIFKSNLDFVSLMKTGVKFNLTRFRFRTLSVFRNLLSCIQQDCKHTLKRTYSSSHVSAQALPSPISAARWHICTTAFGCCCHLPRVVCSNWKDDRTKCVLCSPRS